MIRETVRGLKTEHNVPSQADIPLEYDPDDAIQIDWREATHAAIKSDKSPYYKKKYESLVKRHGKKSPIIAIARMILTVIYQMLSTGGDWNPIDLYKIDMPAPLIEK